MLCNAESGLTSWQASGGGSLPDHRALFLRLSIVLRFCVPSRLSINDEIIVMRVTVRQHGADEIAHATKECCLLTSVFHAPVPRATSRLKTPEAGSPRAAIKFRWQIRSCLTMHRVQLPFQFITNFKFYYKTVVLVVHLLALLYHAMDRRPTHPPANAKQLFQGQKKNKVQVL